MNVTLPSDILMKIQHIRIIRQLLETGKNDNGEYTLVNHPVMIQNLYKAEHQLGELMVNFVVASLEKPSESQ